MSKTYKIFISHSWDHVDDLINLRKKLEERGYFNVEFEDVPSSNPINSTNATYIRSVLSQKIQNSDVVIGLAGMYASYSDWMEWELETAKRIGKPIIGVIPRGQERVSTIVIQKADEIIHWNVESIIKAIRNHS